MEIINKINEFNKTHNKDLYTEILDYFKIKRHKCENCGKDIIYSNTKLSLKKDKLIIEKYSYNYIRKFNNRDYCVVLCEECLEKICKEKNCNSYNKSKNKSTLLSTSSEHIKYAFNIPDEEFKKYNKIKNGNSLEKFISKYGKEEGEKRWERYCNNIAMTKNNLISKYGKEEGEKRWESYCEKQRKTNLYEYKREKYGWSYEDFKNFNKSRSSTKENFIKRHGQVIGEKMWEDYIFRQRYTTSHEYFINQYGEEEGEKRWENFNNARFINKNYSYISQDLFNKLINTSLFKNNEIYFATHNYEYEILFKDLKKLYYLDFYDKTLNICIEFNGNAFHPHPDEYNDNDMFKNIFSDEYTLVKTMRDKENERYKLLKNELNIDTIVVWESEYNEYKDKIIDIILEKVNNILNDRRNE